MRTPVVSASSKRITSMVETGNLLISFSYILYIDHKREQNDHDLHPIRTHFIMDFAPCDLKAERKPLTTR